MVASAPVAFSKAALSLLAMGALLAPAAAFAQGGGDAAAAEALFRQGAAEMDAGNFASACPKIEESFRLDPATGALLTLAACYERSGKVASAWVRYLDVESRAAKEGDKDREAVARQKAAELAPRLPRVTITLAPAVSSLDGVQVRRDQTALAAATLGTPLPIDPGPHVIEVSAPGYAPARREITAVEGRAETVSFDDLVASSSSAPPPPPPVAPPPTEEGRGLTGLQIGGIVVGSVGVAALSTGIIFGVVASGSNGELVDDLGYTDTGVCTKSSLETCRAKYDDVKETATMSTALVIGGSVLAGAGLVMILVGGRESTDNASVELVPSIGGAFLRGKM
jgi:hypothetical protein